MQERVFKELLELEIKKKKKDFWTSLEAKQKGNRSLYDKIKLSSFSREVNIRKAGMASVL